MKTVLTVWHTNDIHSCFEEFAGIVSYLRKHRDIQDLLLDAGDLADERSLIVSGSGGKEAFVLLKEAGYDACAVGNNEFFMGPEKLTGMSEQGIPLLSCNLSRLDGEKISGIQPYTIIEKQGIRILLIGISPYWIRPGDTTEFTDMAGIKLADPVPHMGEILAREKGNYDLSILLSHAGIDRDREYAEVLDADLIIGGHTHTDLGAGECINGTFIHQSGSHAKMLGLVDIELDDKRPVRITARNIPADDIPDEGFLTLVKEAEERGREALKETLYILKEDLLYDPFRECPAGNALADIMHSRYGGDLALINHGILSGDISRTVSKMSLLLASPSILNPTTVFWTGRKIREALQASYEYERISSDGKGSGFRGSVLGTLAVSYNVTVSDRGRKITVNGEALEDEQIYEVITSDYLFRGSGYEMLRGSEKKEIYHPGYFRDLLQETLCREEMYEKAGIRRFVQE